MPKEATVITGNEDVTFITPQMMNGVIVDPDNKDAAKSLLLEAATRFYGTSSLRAVACRASLDDDYTIFVTPDSETPIEEKRELQKKWVFGP